MPRHPSALSEEARSEHVLGPSADDRIEHALEVTAVVLAVAVEVHGSRRSRRRARGRARCGAPPRPRASRGCETTVAPPSRASSAVASAEPSSTTSVSTGSPQATRGSRSSTRPIDASSSRARTIASARSPAATAWPSMAGSSAGTSGRPRAAAGGSTPRSADSVRASSRTERGSWLTAPGVAPAPRDHERNRGLAPVQVSVPADSAPLAVVGHQDHRGIVEPAALLEPGEEALDVAGRWRRPARGTRGCACRARGRAGRPRAAGAPGGRDPPPPRPPARAAANEWSIRSVGWTEVTERTTRSPKGSSRCAIPTSAATPAVLLQHVEDRLRAARRAAARSSSACRARPVPRR